MTAFWIMPQAACVEAENAEAAKQLAEKLTGRPAEVAMQLPYPASPRLNFGTECPSFCYKPKECQGRSSCPQRYSCTE